MDALPGLCWVFSDPCPDKYCFFSSWVLRKSCCKQYCISCNNVVGAFWLTSLRFTEQISLGFTEKNYLWNLLWTFKCSGSGGHDGKKVNNKLIMKWLQPKLKSETVSLGHYWKLTYFLDISIQKNTSHAHTTTTDTYPKAPLKNFSYIQLLFSQARVTKWSLPYCPNYSQIIWI